MRYAAALFAAVGLALVPQVAYAGPPVSETGHTHHVQTGNGCVNIDSVRFLAQDRGLHQGANASGANRGPSHGSC